MPKIICVCGEILPYSEIPCKIEYKFISDIEFDNYTGVMDVEDLYRNMESFLKCPHCNILLIFWKGYMRPPTLYKEINN